MGIAIKKTSGVSLVELCVAAVVGMILIFSTTLIVVWIFKMQMYFQQRINDDMSWITANEYLKKDIHGSSYVNLINDTKIELHNYDGSVKGTYIINKDGNLQFGEDANKIIFEHVAATFEPVYPSPVPEDGKVLEVRVRYSSPSQLSGSIVLKCEVDPGITWARIFNGASKDSLSSWANSVQQTTDGGYIIAGYTDSGGQASGHVYLIKTDPFGVAQWSKTFGNSFFANQAYSVQQTEPDGGYIICGQIKSDNNASNVYLIKTDKDGYATPGHGWSKTFGIKALAYSVQQTEPDGGYIIAGQETSPLVTGQDVYLIKTDSTGDATGTHGWSKTLSGTDGHSVQQTPADGGYIIAGGPLIKTDSTGGIIWTNKFANFIASSIQRTPADGGYIIAGVLGGYASLIKTDSTGDATGTHGWSKTLGVSTTSAHLMSVWQTNPDGGYVVAGWSNVGQDSFYIIKTDPNGDTVWLKRFGEGGFDAAQSVQQTRDGGYVVAGYTDSFDGGNGDVYLIKTDSNGNCPQANTPTLDPGKPTPGD